MTKKVLLTLLLYSAGLMGMELKTEARRNPDGKPSEMVVLKIEDALYQIPLYLIEYSQTIKNLIEDAPDGIIPIPNISTSTWNLILEHLELVHKIANSLDAQKELTSSLEHLSADMLIDLLLAANYLDIQIILDAATQVARKKDLIAISWDKMCLVPRPIRNDLIFRVAVKLFGPVQSLHLAVCEGHEDRVWSVCATDKGKIISGSEDCTVRVWDMEGKQLAVCRGHKSRVTSVCATGNGKIVSGSADGTVHVWDMEGKQLAVCRGHKSRVTSVCATGKGKIISGSEDGTVRVWDMEGKQLAVCEGHKKGVYSVCVTGDGKIVSGSFDKTVRVWDMKGKQLAVCEGHDGQVLTVCVTDDGKIISGSKDGTVRVWDMEGNQLSVCKWHEDGVRSVCVTDDGKIISGCFSTVGVFDMEGKQLAVYKGHANSVISYCVTGDGKIVSGSIDGTVHVWKLQDLSNSQAEKVWTYLQKEIARDHEGWQAIQKILDGNQLNC